MYLFLHIIKEINKWKNGVMLKGAIDYRSSKKHIINNY